MSKVHKMKKHSIEYMYLSVPVNVGYKLLDKKGFTVTHIIKTNDEITTHTFNYHEEGDSFGSHYYSWINDYDHFGGWIFTKE